MADDDRDAPNGTNTAPAGQTGKRKRAGAKKKAATRKKKAVARNVAKKRAVRPAGAPAPGDAVTPTSSPASPPSPSPPDAAASHEVGAGIGQSGPGPTFPTTLVTPTVSVAAPSQRSADIAPDTPPAHIEAVAASGSARHLPVEESGSGGLSGMLALWGPAIIVLFLIMVLNTDSQRGALNREVVELPTTPNTPVTPRATSAVEADLARAQPVTIDLPVPEPRPPINIAVATGSLPGGGPAATEKTGSRGGGGSAAATALAAAFAETDSSGATIPSSQPPRAELPEAPVIASVPAPIPASAIPTVRLPTAAALPAPTPAPTARSQVQIVPLVPAAPLSSIPVTLSAPADPPADRDMNAANMGNVASVGNKSNPWAPKESGGVGATAEAVGGAVPTARDPRAQPGEGWPPPPVGPSRWSEIRGGIPGESGIAGLGPTQYARGYGGQPGGQLSMGAPGAAWYQPTYVPCAPPYYWCPAPTMVPRGYPPPPRY